MKINAQELSIIKQNLQESAINSIFDHYLTTIISNECERNLVECFEMDKIIEKASADEMNNLIFELTKDLAKSVVEKEKFIENYSKVYIDELVNQQVEEKIKDYAKLLKSSNRTLDFKVKHAFDNIFDNYIKNEIEELVNMVYVNELKIRRQNKDINFIFNSTQLKPFIEPIRENIEETIIQEYSTFVEDQPFNLSMSSDSDEEEEQLKPKIINKSTPLIRTTSSSSSFSTNSRQNSSNIETFKGQKHFLNRIKRSAEPFNASQSSTVTNQAELSALIREKKMKLDADMKNRTNDASKSQEDKSSSKRKRNHEETNESTPIKAKSRSPSPLSKRHQKSQIPTRSPFKETQSFVEGMALTNHVHQKGYITYTMRDYFRTFNVKTGFTFEKIDAVLEKFISPKSEFSVDLFLVMLIKVKINFFHLCSSPFEISLLIENNPLNKAYHFNSGGGGGRTF